MDQGWCAGTLLCRIKEGTSNGVQLGGCTLLVLLDFPGPTLFDGNGTARIYVDKNATAEQRREVEPIFQGKRGGPMEILAGLISKWIPTQITGISVRDSAEGIEANVEGFGQIVSTLLKNDRQQQMTVQNAGFACAFRAENDTLVLAPGSGTHGSDPEMPHAFHSRSGPSANCQWGGN